MRVQAPQIYGTAKILVSRLKSIFSEREAKNVVRILTEEITGKPYAFFVVQPEERFSPDSYALFTQAAKRLLDGEPLQYVLEKAWFMGEELYVAPGVLIPRPETEELVEWVLQDLKTAGTADLSVLDIGTGSGCIPILIKKEYPQARVSGIDVSPEALAIAQKNAQKTGVDVEFRKLDILAELPDEFPRFDRVVSNPPYITVAEQAHMDDLVLDHEPPLALFVPDASPLLFYKRIAQLAPRLLHPSGFLYFEINENYGQETILALKEIHSLANIELRQDLSGKDRMIRCQFLPS